MGCNSSGRRAVSADRVGETPARVLLRRCPARVSPNLSFVHCVVCRRGELRILHYYEPVGAFNYRVKTLMVTYKLADDTLTLTFDGKPSTWQRAKVATPAKP